MKRQKTTRETSPLLIDEEPLQVIPSLAVAVGLNEAIILQQIHYWMKRTTHIIDGTPWVYNSYEQWKAQFPFWSAQTIRRAILQLEELGVVISANFNGNPIDKTKWYTINYKRLKDFYRDSTDQDDTSSSQGDISTDQDDTSIDQDDSHDVSRRYVHAVKMIEPIPETTAETTDRDLTHPPTPHERVRVQTDHCQQCDDAFLPKDYSRGFQRILDTYPAGRTQRERECWRLWSTLHLESRTEEILSKIESLKATDWKSGPRRFIPQLKTYLTDAMYDDKPVPLETDTNGTGPALDWDSLAKTAEENTHATE